MKIKFIETIKYRCLDIIFIVFLSIATRFIFNFAFAEWEQNNRDNKLYFDMITD